MIDFSDITFDDHMVFMSAIDVFIEDGYNRHTNDKIVISQNLKTAKIIAKSLKENKFKQDPEHFRVMYSAMLDLRDDSAQIFSSGNRDDKLIKIISTCNKFIPRFEEYFDTVL